MKKIFLLLGSVLFLLLGAWIIWKILYVMVLMVSQQENYENLLIGLWTVIFVVVSDYFGSGLLTVILSFFVMLYALGLPLFLIRYLYIKLREIFYGK